MNVARSQLPPPRRPGSFTNPSPVAFAGDVVHAPVLPVVLVGMSTFVSWALFVVSRQQGAGSSIEIFPASIVGWVLGGLVGAVLLSWFRSVDLTRRSNLTYVEQSWKPALVAGALAIAGWVASIAHAWSIASSVARR